MALPHHDTIHIPDELLYGTPLKFKPVNYCQEGQIVHFRHTLFYPWVLYLHSNSWAQYMIPAVPRLSSSGWIKLLLIEKELAATWDLPITAIFAST